MISIFFTLSKSNILIYKVTSVQNLLLKSDFLFILKDIYFLNLDMYPHLKIM